MTPKERAAMQQALEALEVYGEHAKDCPQYPTYTRPQDYPKCDCGFEEAIAALREALDPELQFVRDWNEGKVRRVSDGKVMGFAEQAEQEPVAWMNKERNTITWNELYPNMTPLYAAPVRTKDLTDDELNALWHNTKGGWLGLLRAVIAADREKNK